MKNYQKGFIVPFVIVVIVFILAGVVYFYTQSKKESSSMVADQSGMIYTNTKFGYQLTLPKGWSLYKYSNKFDVTNRLLTNPQYKDASKYSSPEELKKADPTLATSINNYYSSALGSWSAENAENIIFTNGDQTPEKELGPDKINISVTNHDSSYIENVKEENTESQIIEKIVLKNGNKAFIRQVLIPISGITGTVLATQLDGSGTLESGKKGNTLVFLLSGKVDKDLLLSIANTLTIK